MLHGMTLSPQKIADRAAEAGISRHELCRRAGVDRGTLYRAIRAGRFGQMRTYDALVKALDDVLADGAPSADHRL